MAHFGEAVPDGIVNCASADFAALDMRDRYPQGKCDGCRSKHLVSICDQQQHIRPHRGEAIGKRERRNPDALGHSHIGVGAEQALQAGSNSEAILLNLTNRITEFRRKMRCRNNQLKVHVGVIGQLS
jgi:hypothetical protein